MALLRACCAGAMLESFSPTYLATMSIAPPALNGTMKRIGFEVSNAFQKLGLNLSSHRSSEEPRMLHVTCTPRPYRASTEGSQRTIWGKRNRTSVPTT